jgi:uncharacterized protein (DUF111 family)
MHIPPLPLPDRLPAADKAAVILKARTDLASKFIRGHGLEVGAGSRPFPHPNSAQVLYGDIREKNSLQKYFQETKVKTGENINAQTFGGVENDSLDFVISAHVIEHPRPHRFNRKCDARA